MKRLDSFYAFALLGLGDAAALAAASDCKFAKVAEWPVRVERNRLIVDGAVNGQKIGVLIDTGARRSIIVRAAAERLGLMREQIGARAMGFGGETNVEVATVDELKLGDWTRKNLQMIVAGEHDPGTDIAVLLGEDFLHAFDVEFDLQHKAVRLYQPRNCEGVPIAYWATVGVGEVPLDAPDAEHYRVALMVSINGQPVKAQLDSGAAVSILDKSEAARLGVTPETPGVVAVGQVVGLGSNAADSWIGPFSSFTIGGETITNTEIRFSDWQKFSAYSGTGSRPANTLAGTATMILGADFIRAHRMLLSHSQKKIYFTYAGGPVFQLNRPPSRRADDDRTSDREK